METFLLVTSIFLSGFALGFYSKNLNGKNRKDYHNKICVHQGRCKDKHQLCKGDGYCSYQRNANF